MKWLSLQRTTFVENVGETTDPGNGGGIIDPNPDPQPDPDPDPETGVVALTGYLTFDYYGNKLSVTLTLPRVLQFELLFDIKLTRTYNSQPTEYTYYQFAVYPWENLSNKTVNYALISYPGESPLGVVVDVDSSMPIVKIYAGVTYEITILNVLP